MWMSSCKPHYTSWKMRCLQHLGKSNRYDKALYSLFCLLWKAENIQPKFFSYLDLLSFIFACNSVCLDHSFTKVISNLLALDKVSFYILPFSHFKEAKYNFFTFLWRKLGILLILPDTSTIKTLCPLVSSTSVFLQSLPLNCLLLEWPFQQQYLRRVPMNCFLSWFGKRMAPLSNAAMAQRYILTHFGPCFLIYELLSKDSRERDPNFHHYSLLHNTQIRKPVFSLRKARNYTKKIVPRT